MQRPAALAHPPEAPAEPAADGAVPRFRSRVEEIWFGTGPGLATRTLRTRSEALAAGADAREGAARALVGGDASGEEAVARAQLATQLAPDLPLAHLELARALWSEGAHKDAVGAALAGLFAVPRHLEATVWLVGSLLAMVAAVLVIASLGFIAVVGVGAIGHAMHDLGDLISLDLPAFSRAALLASVFFVPVLLGEGVFGIALVLFVIGFTYGTGRHRVVLGLAAVLIVLGLYPMTRLAGRVLTSLDEEPVASAVLSVLRGIESAPEVERIAAAAPHDALARYALAVRARRRFDAEDAFQRWQALLESHPDDAIVLANVANQHFQRGDTDTAIGLYERAAALEQSARLMFDLSQAYARAFRMEEFERAMQRAQALSSEHVAELSRGGDPSFVADLPLPAARIRDRLFEGGSGEGFVQHISRRSMPGRLGESWIALAGSFAAAAVFSSLISSRFGRSITCRRCGRRVCIRCDGTTWNTEICEGCHHLFRKPEGTDPALRMARLAELRGREARLDRLYVALSLALPGAGGLIAKRPDLAFVGILLFVWALTLFVCRNGIVADPLALGPGAPIVFLMCSAFAAVSYVLVVGVGLLIRRRH